MCVLQPHAQIQQNPKSIQSHQPHISQQHAQIQQTPFAQPNPYAQPIAKKVHSFQAQISQPPAQIQQNPFVQPITTHIQSYQPRVHMGLFDVLRILRLLQLDSKLSLKIKLC